MYALAQGCYAIKSPDTGKFVHRVYKGGDVNDGLTYRFENIELSRASKFYFKPTKLTHFMVTDQDQRFLGSHVPYQVSAGKTPGSYVEWQLNAHRSGESITFSLYSPIMNKTLRHAKWDGGLFFVNFLPPYYSNTETQFELITQSDCTPYPEAELNLTTINSQLSSSDTTSEVTGFVDPHAHITSYEFMGGKMMHGYPFHQYGITEALPDSSIIHGPNGTLDIIGNLMGYGDINHTYDTRGYPDFPFWPNHQQISHQQSYYRWIERTHKAGLQILVSHLVENEVLCNAQKTINPASWISPNSCITTDSVNLQIKRLYEMQDYIDAQAGGPGKGFFRIVKSSIQAREVIADNKLAVIMGMEVSEPFDCGISDNTCTQASIDELLNSYYTKGIRVFFPIHRFDNHFGGAKIEDGFLNLGQALSTGAFFETKECGYGVEGATMTNGFPLIGDIPVLSDILEGLGLQPEYDLDTKHCNSKGLTELGQFLIHRMMDKNIMIEIDHMSPDTTSAVLDIAEQRNYSGIITSHSHTPLGPNGTLTILQQRLAALGGFMAVYNRDTTSLSKRIDAYLTLANQFPYYTGVGFSTDVNGIAPQAAPRPDNAANGVQYPFTSFDGKYLFDKQKTGNREFDYNLEGLAHYGLLADHLEDLRQAGSLSAYESVMRSAEAYLQMWERTENNLTNE